MPAALPGSDAEARRLSSAVAHGDEAAFRQLYDCYHRRLFCLALVLARGDELLAAETVQSVFITAAEKLRAVGSEPHLWNWLARVARQHLAKTWRRQKKDSLVVGMAELPDCADGAAPDSALEECLDAALRAMDVEDRRLIELFYFERLSHKEIAGPLGLTPKAVSSRLERVREKLRALVAQNLSHET
jgi:RNA polymerase sigma-70 factor (ECF subfamily)